MDSAFGGPDLLSFSLMGQNRYEKSSSTDRSCGSFLSRHRPDARGALQQSPILQNDMDKLTRLDYNSKHEVKSLRPFTQLNEQTRGWLFIRYAISIPRRAIHTLYFIPSQNYSRDARFLLFLSKYFGTHFPISTIESCKFIWTEKSQGIGDFWNRHLRLCKQ